MIIQIQGATYAKNYIQETYTNGFIKDLYTGIFRWEDYQNTINDLDSIKEKYREFYRYICYGVYSDLVGIYETSDEFHDIVEAIKIEELNITEANFYDIVMQIENCSQKYYGFNITSSTTLNKDVITYCDINMSSNLYLNGHTLVTYGNLIQIAGQMNISNGTLSVGGDYRIQKPQTDEDGNVTYGMSTGSLYMVNADGRVIVEGTFATSSNWPPSTASTNYNILSAGEMRIGGDFYQYKTDAGSNFASTGTHKVVFTGNKKHVVHFDSTSSRLNIVEVHKSQDLLDMTNAKYNSLMVDNCDYQKGKCDVCGDIENGVGIIRGTSITLSDSISINFYAELSDDAIDSGNVKMQFTYNNTTVLVAPDDVVRKVNGVNCYRFECVLNSKQMDDTVNAKLLLNDREGTELDYSVKEYIDQMSERTDEAAIKAQALLKTTYAYGQIAKGYFNKEQTVIDDAINEKIDSIDLSSLKSQNIYNKTDDGIDGISYYGDSLLLDSQIRERFYFKLDSGEDINSFIFTCNNEVVAPKYKSGLYYIDIAGSSPHKLDKANVVIVTKGSHKLQIENSPISYIYCMKDNGDKDLMKLLKAIVLYYQEAKNYIN